MEWSEYQNAIFQFAENGSGNAIVEAVAGSGKTTTIVEAMNRIAFQYPDSIFLAFNKSIASELMSRGVNARTFHSLCYQPVTKFKGVRSVNNNKTYRLCKHYLSDKDFKLYYAFIGRLVSIAKQLNFNAGNVSTYGAEAAVQYGIELRSEAASEQKAVELAAVIFAKGVQSDMIDFDDLLYYAASDDEIVLPKFDFVFVDEAQDTNQIQHNIIDKIMRDDSRLIAVGDPRQAIYGFRGADSSALSNIAEKFNCHSFPLTVSYRCPQSVVSFANDFVPGTEAFEGAPQGEVRNLKKRWSTCDFNEGDMVLCRTNAPLLSIAYQLIAEGKTPKIMGRDLADGLIRIIQDCRAKSVLDLREKMDLWLNREIAKLMKRSNEEEPDPSALLDKFDCVIAVINAQPEATTVNQLTDSITALFSNDTGEVLLSTIHKAKGLESETVYWLNHNRQTPWAKLDWQIQQERNLCYVAATRSKDKLFLIHYA